ncbi:MAG: MerR family DNA-binding transcriptional regulator [Sphingomonadales bacterium]|jgi:DNA-binding transcriptional MerR regulator
MKAGTIGEIAKASGVSIRTLRHYEALGLIQTRRLKNGHRIFTQESLLQLNRVLLLKRLGIPLRKIAELLKASQINAVEILSLQKQLIEEEMARLSTQLKLIEELLKSKDVGEDINATWLCDLIRCGEEKMTQDQWQKVYDKFYSKEEQEAWAAFKSETSKEDIRFAEEAWPKLIKKIEALLGSDPKGPEAQEVLKEWKALMKAFEPADERIKAGLNRMYQNLDAWPEDGPQQPFSKEVWAFIQKAAS